MKTLQDFFNLAKGLIKKVAQVSQPEEPKKPMPPEHDHERFFHDVGSDGFRGAETFSNVKEALDSIRNRRGGPLGR